MAARQAAEAALMEDDDKPMFESFGDAPGPGIWDPNAEVTIPVRISPGTRAVGPLQLWRASSTDRMTLASVWARGPVATPFRFRGTRAYLNESAWATWQEGMRDPEQAEEWRRSRRRMREGREYVAQEQATWDGLWEELAAR